MARWRSIAIDSGLEATERSTERIDVSMAAGACCCISRLRAITTNSSAIKCAADMPQMQHASKNLRLSKPTKLDPGPALCNAAASDSHHVKSEPSQRSAPRKMRACDTLSKCSARVTLR
eukprot:6212369-Pleurochrysis_carterae.AAC.4